MADFFVAQFLDEWAAMEATSKGTPKYNRKCLEVDFATVSSSPTLQCRGPAYPGDVKCRVADRLMNQMHNEFIRLRDWVDLGEGRKLVTEQHRLAHFLLRSRELVAQEVGECSFARLETIKNPFLSPAQCRHCVKSDELAMLSARDRQTIESRRGTHERADLPLRFQQSEDHIFALRDEVRASGIVSSARERSTP